MVRIGNSENGRESTIGRICETGEFKPQFQTYTQRVLSSMKNTRILRYFIFGSNVRNNDDFSPEATELWTADAN